MGWIAFALWLLLTPIWIAYWFSSGSSSQIAFVAPALALIALGLGWLWKRFVVLVAGEAEPPPRGKIRDPAVNRGREADLVFRPKRSFHPVWGLALPSSGTIRMGLIAGAVGVCVGAAVALDWSTYAPVVSTSEEASRPVSGPDAPISVRTEVVKSPLATAAQPGQNAFPMASSANHSTSDTDSRFQRAEAQADSTPSGQSSSDQPRCDIALCERIYRSFRAADCTYQPYEGPRQYCAR
jgi:hypothetical protein